MTTIRQAVAKDKAAIEAVLDAAFGTDRHQRTAYRVRAGTAPIESLSFVAEQDGEHGTQLVASLQCWPVALRHDGGEMPLVMLGPVAVEPTLQRSGIGKALMKRALATADRMNVPAIMLIGDAEYYGLFGFEAGPTQHWTLPGPFERHRLLVRVKADVTLPQTGDVVPAPLSRYAAA